MSRGFGPLTSVYDEVVKKCMKEVKKNYSNVAVGSTKRGFSQALFPVFQPFWQT
jgi:hypothetical protein